METAGAVQRPDTSFGRGADLLLFGRASDEQRLRIGCRTTQQRRVLLLLLYSLPLPAALAAAALSYSQGELVHVRARARACA